ncbi:cysteine hydrolase [Vibrio alginolyticus]|nr:cysteine hydrolase [Vibrio alginolyticus]EHI5139716.1 cysteine hydrolase [Vibrio alginolyticus]EJL6749876.1 cysteine hydrolase [Vibrio alginolyticus]EJR0949511.1 cysteine hydrolase [Vibrio alginolyticus]ELB1498800.1 cysteine hydrolase [Vibrio alginolyticus]
MGNTALLLIDYQNDYFPSYSEAKWPLSETEMAANNGAKLLSLFREKNRLVIHVRHESLTNDAPFFQPNSEGAAIHSSVVPIDGEPVIVKHEINSFKGTNLSEILSQGSVEKLIIVGAMSHMCIDAIARAASDLGYECIVAHDACTTLPLEFNGITVPASHVHASFMSALNFGYCNVDSTEAIAELVA